MNQSPDFYQYYYAHREGKKPTFYDGQPQGGYWQMKEGDELIPIHIFHEEDDPSSVILLKAGLEITDEKTKNKIWQRCGRNSVDEKDYTYRMEKGAWPFQGAKSIGHNSGNDEKPEDPVEACKLEIDVISAWFEKLGEITNDDQGNEANDKRNYLASLRLDLEKRHKREKAPHHEAGKKVDATYNPTITKSKTLESKIRNAVTTYANKQELERRKKEAEARRAEEAKKQEDIKNLLADDNKSQDEKVAAIMEAQSKKPEREAVPEKKFGTTGRSIKAKIKRVAYVKDQDAVYQLFKDDPSVQGLLKKLAQQYIDNGNTNPAIEVKEE